MNRRMSPAAMTSAFPSTRFARLPLCRAPKSNPANPRNPVVPQSQRRIRVRTKAGVGFRSSTGFFEGPRQLLKPRGASLHAMISSVQNPRSPRTTIPAFLHRGRNRRRKLGQCRNTATVPVFFLGVQVRTKKPNRSRTWPSFTVTF